MQQAMAMTTLAVDRGTHNHINERGGGESPASTVHEILAEHLDERGSKVEQDDLRRQ